MKSSTVLGVADTDDAVPLSTVIGRNARRLRGDITADAVAKSARYFGLNWGTGRISDLEHGRVSPTLPTLVALAMALESATFPGGGRVTIADLLASDEPISLTTAFALTSEELTHFLAGEEFAQVWIHGKSVRLDEIPSPVEVLKNMRDDWPKRLHDVPKGATLRLSGEFGEPEQRLGRDLGLDDWRLAAEMLFLWQRTYSAERDERAGPGANAQKKGRVARELKAELKAVLDGDDQ